MGEGEDLRYTHSHPKKKRGRRPFLKSMKHQRETVSSSEEAGEKNSNLRKFETVALFKAPQGENSFGGKRNSDDRKEDVNTRTEKKVRGLPTEQRGKEVPPPAQRKKETFEKRGEREASDSMTQQGKPTRFHPRGEGMHIRAKKGNACHLTNRECYPKKREHEHFRSYKGETACHAGLRRL